MTETDDREIANINNYSCKHIFCFHCLSLYCISKIKVRKEILCPEQQCHEKLTLQSRFLKEFPVKVERDSKNSRELSHKNRFIGYWYYFIEYS